MIRDQLSTHSSHPRLDEALEILSQALAFGVEPSLEGMNKLCQLMGSPQDSFDSIQIAGTNGKTSTSRFIAAILSGHGKKMGLYTSPQLVHYPERIEINGSVVSDEVFAYGICKAYEVGQHNQIASTEFELLTAGAFAVFENQAVDAVALEVGLGGRWDATSVVNPRTSVITGVALDHCALLGDTKEQIAQEKAAIITPGFPVVLAASLKNQPRVQAVFVKRAQEVGSPVIQLEEIVYDQKYALGDKVSPQDSKAPCPQPSSSKTKMFKPDPQIQKAYFCVEKTPHVIGDVLQVCVQGLYATYRMIERRAPHYQAQNMALALVACEAYVGHALDEAVVREALKTCRTPGRFSVVRTDPLLLIDACHNPDSVAAFMGSLLDQVKHADHVSPPDLLLACLADKDAAHMVEAIDPYFTRIAVTQTVSPRALEAPVLADIVKRSGRSCVGCYQSVQEALEAYADRPLIACGSITLAGEIMRIMQRN